MRYSPQPLIDIGLAVLIPVTVIALDSYIVDMLASKTSVKLKESGVVIGPRVVIEKSALPSHTLNVVV